MKPSVGTLPTRRKRKGVRPPQRIAGVYNTGGGPHFGSGLTIDTAAELYGNKA